MKISYDRLKDIANEVRADLALRGAIDVSKGKIRKKPRSQEKTELLYTMAMDRLKKNRPYRNSDNELILPYFRGTAVFLALTIKQHDMEKEGVIKEPLNMIVRIIRRHLDKSYKVLLFGSWAASRALPTSDIDIAIYGGSRVDGLTIAKIRDEIADLPTLRKIDVIDAWEADEHFRSKILKEAEVLD